MIAHMNEDHADAVVAYVHHFGSQPAVRSAILTRILPDRMEIEATGSAGTSTVHIPFDHILRDTDDARDTLIAMARAAAPANVTAER